MSQIKALLTELLQEVNKPRREMKPLVAISKVTALAAVLSDDTTTVTAADLADLSPEDLKAMTMCFVGIIGQSIRS